MKHEMFLIVENGLEDLMGETVYVSDLPINVVKSHEHTEDETTWYLKHIDDISEFVKEHDILDGMVAFRDNFIYQYISVYLQALSIIDENYDKKITITVDFVNQVMKELHSYIQPKIYDTHFERPLTQFELDAFVEDALSKGIELTWLAPATVQTTSLDLLDVGVPYITRRR